MFDVGCEVSSDVWACGIISGDGVLKRRAQLRNVDKYEDGGYIGAVA